MRNAVDLQMLVIKIKCSMIQVCKYHAMIQVERRILLAPSLGGDLGAASAVAPWLGGGWRSGVGRRLTEAPTHRKLRPPGACTQEMDACRGEALGASGSCAHDTLPTGQPASR